MSKRLNLRRVDARLARKDEDVQRLPSAFPDEEEEFHMAMEAMREARQYIDAADARVARKQGRVH